MHSSLRDTFDKLLFTHVTSSCCILALSGWYDCSTACVLTGWVEWYCSRYCSSGGLLERRTHIFHQQHFHIRNTDRSVTTRSFDKPSLTMCVYSVRWQWQVALAFFCGVEIGVFYECTQKACTLYVLYTVNLQHKVINHSILSLWTVKSNGITAW